MTGQRRGSRKNTTFTDKKTKCKLFSSLGFGQSLIIQLYFWNSSYSPRQPPLLRVSLEILYIINKTSTLLGQSIIGYLEPRLTPTTDLNWPAVSELENFWDCVLASGALRATVCERRRWGRCCVFSSLDADGGDFQSGADEEEAVPGELGAGAGASPGVSEVEHRTRTLVADHVAAGALESAMQLCAETSESAPSHILRVAARGLRPEWTLPRPPHPAGVRERSGLVERTTDKVHKLMVTDSI
ncbi:hypothetical protein HGRIS_006549 [Hohenbuehelia grisea]|uniref:Uncharacterized protein n=1 Tax=Hohenbuehelia grisea TaxID=104357 RepID=A0ABR3J9C2_9AGAR